MKISIIIPTLNAAKEIESTLRPLQKLRVSGHEIILSDGGSSDETLRLAANFTDKIVSGKKGRAIQQNRGAIQATSDWLFFLHADTQIPKQFQTILEQELDDSVSWGRFDVRLSGKHPMFRIIEKMMNWRSRSTGIATGDQLIFVRRDIFQQVGGFPKITLMEDIEISKRLKRISPPKCLRHKVLTSSRRWEKNGIIKTIILMWWLRLNYFMGRDPERLAQIYYPNH